MPPSSPFRRARHATALAAALAAALYAAPIALAPAFAQGATASAPIAWDLPAGPLDDTLARIASESKRTITAPAALLAGKRAGAVRGSLGVEAAILRALAGTGLELAVTPSGTFTVRPASQPPADAPPAPAANAAPTGSLAEVRVHAPREQEEADGPVGALVARRSATATKTDTPLLETPQTVSVVPREQIELQGAQTVTQALSYLPGVLPAFGGTNTQSDVVQTRGFFPRDYLDGLRLPFSAYSVAVPQFDPYMLERIELLQGPASVLFGQSTPGGVLNMVSRRPQVEPAHELLLQGGNFGRRQLAFDSTGAIDAHGRFSYRLSGLARENDGQIDHAWERRRMIAPSFTWRPSADTRLTLLAHAQQDHLVPQYQSLPAKGTLELNPNGALPRSRMSGDPAWDRIERRQSGIGYAFEHRINTDWTLRQNLRNTGVDVHSRAMPGVALMPDNRRVARVATESWAAGSIFAVDTAAEGRFATGPLQHTLLLGLDHMRQHDEYRFASNTAPTLDLYAPVYGVPVSTPILRLDTDHRMRQTGFYAQDQVRWARWVLTAGLRHDKAKSETLNRLSARTAYKDDAATTGRLGVNYVFDSGIAPYASYSTSFEPVAGTDFAGTPFEPSKGRQVEVGVKYQPPESRTLVTLAAYRLRQQNVLTPDPSPGRTGFSVQTGEVEVNGLSLEARTEFDRHWNLTAAYAYTDSEVTRANPSAGGASLLGRPLSRTPRHQGALWVGYRFGPGALAGVTLGGGVRYLGPNFTDTALSIRLPGVTLWDLSAHYDFPAQSDFTRDLRLSLGVANLADRKYVSYCLNNVQCFYGQRRTVQLSVRKRW